MRVLLTGACGFIGSHLLRELLTHHVPVAVVLRPDSNSGRIQSSLSNVTKIEGDLTNPSSYVSAVAKFAPDLLINLAWYGVENRYANDPEQIVKNLALVRALFEMAKNVGITSIVSLGSQAEYGPQETIIHEMTQPMPTTLYGAAKLAAYHLWHILCYQHHIRFCWLRLFSSYGPADNMSWLIPFIISELLKGNKPKLTRGEQCWDYLYVEDVVKAIFAVADCTEASGVFNLGSGHAYPVKMIAEMIRDQIDSSLPLNLGAIPYKVDQVMHLQADIKRLKSTVGWQPQVSLSEGIKKTIEWFKSNDALQFS